MEGQSQILIPSLGSERGELVAAFRNLIMKLRHVRMSRVRRDIRRHPVHRDLLPREVLEDLAQISNRDTQVRVRLPPSRIVALQPCLSQDLYRKTKPQRVSHYKPDAGSSRQFHNRETNLLPRT